VLRLAVCARAQPPFARDTALCSQGLKPWATPGRAANGYLSGATARLKF